MADVDRASETLRVVKSTGGARPFVTRQIAGETLIVPVRDNVADLDAIYTLNEVGSRIWQLIEGPTPVGQIARRISEEYEVSASQAAEETSAFLTELHTIGLIHFVEGHDQG